MRNQSNGTLSRKPPSLSFKVWRVPRSGRPGSALTRARRSLLFPMGILIAPCVRCRSLISGVGIAVSLCFAVGAASTSVLAADVQISGSREKVHVEARDTSVEEILAGLDKTLNVHHRSSTRLDKRLNGTYEGSAHSVIKRVLDGYNFFLKTEDGDVEVTVLGESTGILQTAASPSYRVTDRPIELDPAQAPPALAAAEPQPPFGGIKPDQPPSPTPTVAGPRVRSSSGAPSFRRLHRIHSIANEQRPSRPHKARVAGKAWHSSHLRYKRFARSAVLYCSWNGRFALAPTVSMRAHSWSRWEAWCSPAGIFFDCPRYWLAELGARRRQVLLSKWTPKIRLPEKFRVDRQK